MIPACAPLDPGASVAERLTGFLDCHARTLGEAGFAALSKSWLGPALLTGCLTIYVALIGYRILLGRPFGARDALLAALRAGAVIAFATAWPSYETVVYRVVTDGPAEVAAPVLVSSDLPALSPQDLARRLQQDYAALIKPDAPAPAATPSEPSATTTPSAPERSPTLTHAGLVLMISVIGSLMVVRLAAGVLLALGPLFVALALFDVMLGVLEGWARALIGAFVGAVGTMIVTGLELGFIETQLPLPASAATDPNALLRGPGLALTVDLFALGLFGMLVMGAVVGWGFRIPAGLFAGRRSLASSTAARSRAPAHNAAASAAPEPERARAVAEAVLRVGRRERAQSADAGAAFERFARARDLSAGPASDARSPGGQPLGSRLRRRTARPRAAGLERLGHNR